MTLQTCLTMHQIHTQLLYLMQLDSYEDIIVGNIGEVFEQNLKDGDITMLVSYEKSKLTEHQKSTLEYLIADLSRILKTTVQYDDDGEVVDYTITGSKNLITGYFKVRRNAMSVQTNDVRTMWQKIKDKFRVT